MDELSVAYVKTDMGDAGPVLPLKKTRSPLRSSLLATGTPLNWSAELRGRTIRFSQ